MDVIIVVDMQLGLLNGPPKHDLQGVIERINLLTAIVRKQSGKVIWVRHCGKTGDGFERHTEGWSFLPELGRCREDLVVETTLNDRLYGRHYTKPWHGLRQIESSSSVGLPIPVSTRPSDQLYQTTITSLLLAMVTQ